MGTDPSFFEAAAQAEDRARVATALASQEEFEQKYREKQAAEEVAALASAAAAVLEVFPPAPEGAAELGEGRRTEWALRLLCSWTIGKPEQADEVLQGLAVLTVDSVIRLTGGR